MLEFIKYLPSQENVDCCAASATLLAAEIIMSMNHRPLHFSRLFSYYMSRKMQGRPGLKGTSLAMTLESISLYGVCLDRDWPLRTSLKDMVPSFTAISEAEKYKVNLFHHVPISRIHEYVHHSVPVIVGIRTGRQFWKLSGPIGQQNYTPVNDTTNQHAYDHAVVIVGNMPEKRCWIIANSKGLKWGDKGIGILPYECAVDIGESYSIIDFAGFVVGKFLPF